MDPRLSDPETQDEEQPEPQETQDHPDVLDAKHGKNKSKAHARPNGNVDFAIPLDSNMFQRET